MGKGVAAPGQLKSATPLSYLTCNLWAVNFWVCPLFFSDVL